jgi:tRNA C32,U32 (ribose-2'-O)-methylase TrmJ
VESLCDVIVSLPLAGKVDSLNVSVSTGILLYEAVRQRVAVGAAGTAAPHASAEAESAEPGAVAEAGVVESPASVPVTEAEA